MQTLVGEYLLTELRIRIEIDLSCPREKTDLDPILYRKPGSGLINILPPDLYFAIFIENGVKNVQIRLLRLNPDLDPTYPVTRSKTSVFQHLNERPNEISTAGKAPRLSV